MILLMEAAQQLCSNIPVTTANGYLKSQNRAAYSNHRLSFKFHVKVQYLLNGIAALTFLQCLRYHRHK